MAEQAAIDNPLRALGVVVGVAVVCALLVSLTAVELRPRQVANLEAYRLARLESILSVLSDRGHAVTAGDIESRVVELVSGRYSDSLDAATFDARKAVNDPGASVTIPPLSMWRASSDGPSTPPCFWSAMPTDGSIC